MVPVVGPNNEDLDPAQKQELRELVDRNMALLSVKPGRTTLMEHHIRTQPRETVRKRPCRIPEAGWEGMKQEVEAMLRIGVVEESHSAWCSPIVLVPKLDGSLRFCNDFRGVKYISLFDAHAEGGRAHRPIGKGPVYQHP